MQELKEEINNEKASAAKAEQTLEELRKKHTSDLDRLTKKFSEERAALKAEVEKLHDLVRQERCAKTVLLLRANDLIFCLEKRFMVLLQL